MTEDVDWAQTALRLEELARELIETREVEDSLEGALKLATQVGPCDVASISLWHRVGGSELTSASDVVAERAHVLQQELGEGPFVDVEWGGNDTYVVTEVADADRWPRWAPQALELGLASLLSVRLFTTEEVVGALHLYSFLPRDFDTDEVLVARILGARISPVFVRVRREETLTEAIDARHNVGLAQGILMERYGISPDQAFQVLRRYSQDQHRKLRVIAQEVVERGRLPG